MGYPFDHGYCESEDVVARIKLGRYDPTIPGNVGGEYIDLFIEEGATEIDLVLARVGYTVPLAAAEGLVIQPQVWSKLKMINATWAAAHVEMWRHSTDQGSGDQQAERLLGLADDMLTRLQSGADNLALFGVGGPFTPESDPALAMDTNMDDLDPLTSLQPQPIFTVDPAHAVGYPDANSASGNPAVYW
jgi:hypothetical protein